MDNNAAVSEVERGLDDEPAVHHRPVESELLIRPLILTDVDVVKDILEKYSNLKAVKSNPLWFRAQLLERVDSYFATVGEVGLLFLTDVVPEFTASFNLVFWDRKLGKARQAVILEFLRSCAEEFDLERIQATVPVLNRPLYAMLLRTGFKEEGLLRKAWREADGFHDVHILSILREELV